MFERKLVSWQGKMTPAVESTLLLPMWMAMCPTWENSRFWGWQRLWSLLQSPVETIAAAWTTDISTHGLLVQRARFGCTLVARDALVIVPQLTEKRWGLLCLVYHLEVVDRSQYMD